MGHIVAEYSSYPNIKEIFQMLITFLLTVLAWIFFRAENITHAFSILNEIFSKSFFTIPYYEGLGFAKSLLVLILIFIIIEWGSRRKAYAIEPYVERPVIIRWVLYCSIIILIGMFMHTEETDFIYFQF